MLIGVSPPSHIAQLKSSFTPSKQDLERNLERFGFTWEAKTGQVWGYMGHDFEIYVGSGCKFGIYVRHWPSKPACGTMQAKELHHTAKPDHVVPGGQQSLLVSLWMQQLLLLLASLRVPSQQGGMGWHRPPAAQAKENSAGCFTGKIEELHTVQKCNHSAPQKDNVLVIPALTPHPTQ
eukprot:1143124-Pelagomonas_calceolata.AAC.4